MYVSKNRKPKLEKMKIYFDEAVNSGQNLLDAD